MGICYEVGEVIEDMKTRADESYFRFLGDRWEWAIGCQYMTDQQLKEILNGQIFLGFTEVEGVLMFVFKVGEWPLGVAPYEPRLYPDTNYPYLKKSDPAMQVEILAVDSRTGILNGKRFVSLTNEHVRKLHNACRKKLKNGPITLRMHGTMLYPVYNKCPEPKDFLPKAVILNAPLYIVK